MPCPFLNTERGFGGKPPQKSEFRRHLAGSKMPRDVFHGDLPLERGLAARARCLGFLAGVAAVRRQRSSATATQPISFCSNCPPLSRAGQAHPTPFDRFQGPIGDRQRDERQTPSPILQWI